MTSEDGALDTQIWKITAVAMLGLLLAQLDLGLVGLPAVDVAYISLDKDALPMAATVMLPRPRMG